MSFEDELADIIKDLHLGEEPTLAPDLVQHVVESLKQKDTYGYLVYVRPSGDSQSMGLVAINGYDEAKLAHSHRIADKLIDDIFMDNTHDESH